MPANPGLDRVRAAATRVAESHGLELFDLQFRRESIGWVLRVVIDRRPGEESESAPAAAAGVGPRDKEETSAAARANGGGAPFAGKEEDAVSIQDCQRVSQDLGTLLDVDEELGAELGEKYTLEVSSPGMDRPLRDERDYRRFEGRLAKIVTIEPIERQTSFAGRLAGIDDGAVLLTEGRRVHRIPLGAIKRARLEVEF
jgi:ribosome maturation factor RimP